MPDEVERQTPRYQDYMQRVLRWEQAEYRRARKD